MLTFCHLSIGNNWTCHYFISSCLYGRLSCSRSFPLSLLTFLAQPHLPSCSSSLMYPVEKQMEIYWNFMINWKIQSEWLSHSEKLAQQRCQIYPPPTVKGVFRRCVIITSVILFFFNWDTLSVACQHCLHPITAQIHLDPSLFFPCCLLFCFFLHSSVDSSELLSPFGCAPRPVIALKSLDFFMEFIFLGLYFLPPPSAPCITPSLPADEEGGNRKEATSPSVKLDGAINSLEVWLAARWLQPSFHSANRLGWGQRGES